MSCYLLELQVYLIKEATQKAKFLLKEIGVDHRQNHLPKQLSGGEQQRVAIARALIQEPDILFADEPTGNLDNKNAQVIEEIFFNLHETKNLTLIVATHDQKFSQRFPRVLNLKDGQLKSEKENDNQREQQSIFKY